MKIAVIGAAGRTGRHILSAIAAHPQAELAAAVERADHALLGTEVSQWCSIEKQTGVTLTSTLSDALELSDVMIDFSLPAGLRKRVEAAARAGVGVVIGTTGLDDSTHSTLELAAKQVPVVVAPNMSVGVNVMLALLREAAKMLGPGYDFEVFEMHHRGKVDSPSGTALRIAEVVASERGVDLGKMARHGRSGAVGAREEGEIGVHAARGGDVVGEHTAIFAGAGERIEIIHRAHSRDTFASGAVRAALWTAGRSPGLYGMADVLAGGGM